MLEKKNNWKISVKIHLFWSEYYFRITNNVDIKAHHDSSAQAVSCLGRNAALPSLESKSFPVDDWLSQSGLCTKKLNF